MSFKLSSNQKIACVTVIFDMKIISLFCVSGEFRSKTQSPVQIKDIFQPGSISLSNG